MRLPDPERSRVLLLGTTRYADPKLPKLTVVRKTIDDLALSLTDPTYGVVPQKHCTTLVDEGDLRLLGRQLRSIVQQAEDLLLVYYTGHGLVSSKRHELYLALPDSDWTDPEFNSLEYDKLRRAVLDSPASTKVVILDCCFSGRVVTETMAGPVTEMLGQIEVDGTYVLTSSQREEVALVLPSEEHTAFTGRLIRLLREGLVGGPELLSIDDIYKQLLVTMKSEGLPTPQQRGTKTANLLALGHNRAFATTAAPILRKGQEAAFKLGETGDWVQAATLLREVVAEQVRILGLEHPDTLRSRQFLAHSLGGAGDPLQAAGLLRELLVEQTQVLGSDHPDTLCTRQFMAVNLGEAGYRADAVELLRVLLADRRRVLGPDDPHSLRTCHMLARNLAIQGNVDEAVALFRELIQARERVIGPNDALTERAREDLTRLREQLDERTEG